MTTEVSSEDHCSSQVDDSRSDQSPMFDCIHDVGISLKHSGWHYAAAPPHKTF